MVVSNEYKGYFDLVICHDVIEHIGNKQEMLSRIEYFLKPSGLLFIGFPAWQMPFGGHQQICHNKLLSIIPFYHLLPQRIYKTILYAGGESKECVNELLSIKNTKITIEKFEKLIDKTSFRIVDRCLYLINPHYEIKFGLKPRRLAGVFARMPYIRNFLSTSCFYILHTHELGYLAWTLSGEDSLESRASISTWTLGARSFSFTAEK